MVPAGPLAPGLADWRYAALAFLVGLVLVLPFVLRAVERHLEAFLLAIGAAAVTVSGGWSAALVREALREPVRISLAVLAAGLLFHVGRRRLDRALARMLRILPLPLFLFLAVAGLGLLASVLTAIIAALVLVEVVGALPLARTAEVRFTVLACFAIGLGAALTPVGEPLSAIVTARLHGDVWCLARLLAWYLVPGILAFGLLAARIPSRRSRRGLADTRRAESAAAVWGRAGRVYAFVAALLFLGAGLGPLVDRFVAVLPAAALFWANMVSAVLDNATLAAAEVGPALTRSQQQAVLLGLLVSGGMLIPGNIPNIVAAGHLKIRSREWARAGLPVGLAAMAVAFAAWLAAAGRT